MEYTRKLLLCATHPTAAGTFWPPDQPYLDVRALSVRTLSEMLAKDPQVSHGFHLQTHVVQARHTG